LRRRMVALLLAGRMPVAAAVAAAVAVQQLNGRLSVIAASSGMLFEHTLFINDFNSFLELAPAVRAARPTGPAPAGFEVLSVEHLSFSYPQTDSDALADISLEIRRGEVVALVGATAPRGARPFRHQADEAAESSCVRARPACGLEGIRVADQGSGRRWLSTSRPRTARR
ncbi:MAG: hypothetical protein M3507_03590, partial [Actinomycetota bacterium]|nr:hypothetical protein [Actinomycetota bacterium]